MCDSDQLKKPLYQLVKQDSRNAAWLGNAVGWQGLEDEGKHNVKNPGHAVTKAAEYAAAIYLGGLLGGGGDAAVAGGEAAAATAEEVAAEQAAAQLAQQAPQGLANTMEAGMTDTGYTPSSLWNAVKNYDSGQGVTGNLANYGKSVATNAQNGGLLNQLTSGSSGSTGNKALMAQQGLKMMFPEQPPYQAPPAQAFQGQQGPLQSPNERSPYGTSAGNSLGFTEEQKRKLRAMGYQI